MKKRIYFNAFHMNCVVHQSPGLWVLPGDKMENYTDLNTWIELARLLERGKFDALFLADVVGVYDVFRGNREAALTQAAQTPVNEPHAAGPGYGRSNRTPGLRLYQFDPPVPSFHLCPTHLDARPSYPGPGGLEYRDFVIWKAPGAAMAGPVCPNMTNATTWRMSIARCATSCGNRAGRMARWSKTSSAASTPTRVRCGTSSTRASITKWTAVNLSEPSPQRTPVLYQAGSSSRGQAFAARHAECVFIASPTLEVARKTIQATRKQAEQNGRNPEDILFFAYLKTVTGGTEAEVKQKYSDYLEHTSYDGSMALWCGWAGYDLGQLDPDEPLEYVETNAIRTLWNNFVHLDPERKWRVRDLAKYVGLGGGGPVVAGTPEQIADEFQKWTEAGVDGFNLAYAVTPGTFEEFVDGVVPVLQKRGMMQTEYQDGTLREKLYGAGQARLSPPHPAVQYRRSESAPAQVSSQSRQDGSASVAVAK